MGLADRPSRRQCSGPFAREQAARIAPFRPAAVDSTRTIPYPEVPPMQRKYLSPVAAFATLAISGTAWQLTRSQPADASDPGGKGDGKSAPLPITQVILFNSGVGYLQREGDVTGDTRV